LLQFPEVEPQYMIFVERERDRLDTMEVWVEASNELYIRGEDAIKEVEKRVRKAMLETLFVSAAVRVVGPGSIERSLGKARRVVDRRELG
jgi:phenylacetate-CoA ligase